MSGPRVRPGTFREVSLVAWVLAHAGGRVNRLEPLQIFLVLGKHPALFRGWLGFARRLMPFGKLPRREAELVILRVAHLAGSDYEHHQHVRIGRRVGVTTEDLERLHAWPQQQDGWSPRERAILDAVEQLHHERDLSDARWDALCAHLSEKERLELLLLAGHYEMLATVLGVLRLQPEERRR